MRAVIDIGTNSILLLLAERDADGRVKVHSDRSRVTRLGQGVVRTKHLDPLAVSRTLEVLREYRTIAQEHEAPLKVVATEGLRMAADPETFLEPASEAVGQPIRVLSGEEEAELSYRSVAQELSSDTPLRVLDIGGGSTELVVGLGCDVLDRRSHPIGSVRLTEQFITSDPPTLTQVALVAQAARECLAEQLLPPQPVLHGLAGTVTTVAALLLGLEKYDRERVDGSQWTFTQVEALRDYLVEQTVAQRSRSEMLPPGRSDVIVAGVTILVEALRHCGAHTLVVRDRGLRYALV